MSLGATAWAWEQECSPVAKLLLLYAADSWFGYHPKEGEVIALSMRAFRQWCQADPDDVAAANSELVSLGLFLPQDNFWNDPDRISVKLAYVSEWELRDRESAPKRKPLSRTIRARIYARDQYQCVACGTNKSLQVDHIHPVSRGGGDEPENLQTLCQRCNASKGTKTMDEWKSGGGS